MTPEQENKVFELARKAKEVLNDFVGSITIHFHDKVKEPKVEYHKSIKRK